MCCSTWCTSITCDRCLQGDSSPAENWLMSTQDARRCLVGMVTHKEGGWSRDVRRLSGRAGELEAAGFFCQGKHRELSGEITADLIISHSHCQLAQISSGVGDNKNQIILFLLLASSSSFLYIGRSRSWTLFDTTIGMICRFRKMWNWTPGRCKF